MSRYREVSTLILHRNSLAYKRRRPVMFEDARHAVASQRVITRMAFGRHTSPGVRSSLGNEKGRDLDFGVRTPSRAWPVCAAACAAQN